jgi:hypothetical protein
MRVDLMYIDSIFNNEEIKELKSFLDIEGVNFKVIDKGRRITANIDELNPVITIFIDFAISSGLLVSLGASAVWDGFKTMVKYVVLKTKGKKFYKVTSKKVEERDRTISIVTRINNNEIFFKLEGLESVEELDLALEKLLPIIEKQLNEMKSNNQIYIASFDKILNEWVTENFIEKIRRENGL